MCLFSRSRIVDRLRSNSRAHEQEGGLCNLRTTTPESIALPDTPVPCRAGNLPDHVLEDSKALRNIFSTPSSIRGYKAARAIRRADDTARHSPPRSANGRLGALGHAVKQRLSESRLSKESSRIGMKRKSSDGSPQGRGLLSTSHVSTGLSDLLLSRNGSEGGYDSDAKAISTLRLRMSSNPESLNIGPEYLTEALRSQKDSSPKKRSSAPAILEHESDPLEVAVDAQTLPGQVHPTDLATACTDVQEVIVPEACSTDALKVVDAREERKIVSSTSEELSDNQSIHLGDMRISQRLASTSVMPINSLSSTNFGASTDHDAETDLSPSGPRTGVRDMHGLSLDNDLPWHLQRQLSITGRYPGLITQEHNRRPSDPKTRRLFEDATDESKLHPKWKSVTGASNNQASFKAGQVARDSASSPDRNRSELHSMEYAGLMDAVHSGKIKNPNSMAIPGRRASVAADQRFGSLGQSTSSEEDAHSSKHKRQHSLQAFEDGLEPHDKDSEGLSAYGEGGSVSRHEAMSEIKGNRLQEDRNETMSDMGLEMQVPQPRHHSKSTEPRSTASSQGWLTQGRRSGFGYNFIQRTSSCNSRFSCEKDVEKGPKDETAEQVWDRAFTKARADSMRSTSKSMLYAPLWSDQTERKISSSDSYKQRTPCLSRRTSISTERKVTPNEVSSGFHDPLEVHQRVTVEVPTSLPRPSAPWSVKAGQNDSSQATSMKESPRNMSLFNVRRGPFANIDDEETTSPTVPADFSSWCKFPSHSRAERNGPASEKEGVRARDFSPPTPGLRRSESKSDVTIHRNRCASSPIPSRPASWRKRALGHMRRRSRSMTSTRGPPKHKESNRSLFWQLKNFYRSQSSDLRRLQAGHRSSVTLSRESKYPELEIPAGFGPLTPFDVSPAPLSRMSSDQARILEGTGEDNGDSTAKTDVEFWRTGIGISTGHETENCSPGGETKRRVPPQAVLKSHFSSGFEGTISSKISVEHAGDMTKSDSDLSSARKPRGNDTCGSFVSVTASNGFGEGGDDFGVHTREFRLVSTELRDSTIDFRTALLEREQRSINDLLRLANCMGGVGDRDADESLEKKDGREQNKA